MLVFTGLITAVLAISGVTMAILDRLAKHARFAEMRLAPPVTMRASEAERMKLNAVNSALSAVLVYGGFLAMYPVLFASEAAPWWVAGLQGVAILAVYDLLYYALHRGMHHKKVMRLIHRVHHQARNPTAKDSLWVHPAELIAGLLTLMLSTGVVSLAAPIDTAGFILAFFAYSEMNLFIHSGVQFRGPLAVFNTVTRGHYGHHMMNINRNFGSLTPLWDIVFRTHLRIDLG